MPRCGGSYGFSEFKGLIRLEMKSLPQLGRALFIGAIVALGIQAFICATPVYELEPIPVWVPWQIVLANITGFLLVLLGIGMVLDRSARTAAVALGTIFFAWVLFLHVPTLIRKPMGDLSFAFETLALSAVAWTMALESPRRPEQSRRWMGVVGNLGEISPMVFGTCIAIFCVVNFKYHRAIANMIPAWIPAHEFWAYFTGIASLFAGLSILTKVQVRLATTLLGIMYGSWVLVIHIPYLARHSGSREIWSDMFITLALAGGAWVIGGTFKKEHSIREAVRSWRELTRR